MKLHKWDGTICTKCRISRIKKTFKLCMAITADGKSHYQYSQQFVYTMKDGSKTTIRPECI